MSTLRIYTIQDKEVRMLSKDIALQELNSKKMQDFAADLIDAMIRFEGIGIASCQVGKTIQMIVIAKEFSGTPEHQVLINPRLVSVGNKMNRLEEGCLSVPGTFGIVERESKVRVKAYGLDGKPVDIKAKGMYARILQHEIDHLNGVLFIDKAKKITKQDSPVAAEPA